MIPTTINVQITKNPKQYEAVRLGLEASLEPGESVESAIKAATSQLNELYVQMYVGTKKAPQAQNKEQQTQAQAPAPAPAPAQAQAKDERELLTLDDKRVQQIVKRIEKNPEKKAEILANVDKYYRYDEQVANVFGLTAKLV